MPSGLRTAGPAFVEMADDVFADHGPLLEIRRRVDAVFLRPVLDFLPKAEERLRAGLGELVHVPVRVRQVWWSTLLAEKPSRSARLRGVSGEGTYFPEASNSFSTSQTGDSRKAW